MTEEMAPRHQRELKRDPGVELARFSACLIVMGTHCWFGTSMGYADDVSRNLISCFLADGVAVFWLITGCFLFNRYSYKKTMVHMVKGVLVPLAVYSFAMFFFVADLVDGTFSWDAAFDGQKILNGLQDLLHWRNPVEGYGLVWFLYIYMLLMICSPALYGLSVWLDESGKREAGFLAVTLALFVMNDITCNGTWQFSHYGIGGLVPASVEVMWGHILYRHRDELAGKGRWAVYLLAFVVLNLLRTAIQMGRYQSGLDDNSILYWYSSIGVFCAGCVLLGCCSAIRSRKATVPSRLVCWAASYTFTVYLIHVVVRNLLDNLFGFRAGLYAALDGLVGGAVAEVLYVVVAVVVVGAIALAVAVVLRLLWRAVRVAAGFVVRHLSGRSAARA